VPSEKAFASALSSVQAFSMISRRNLSGDLGAHGETAFLDGETMEAAEAWEKPSTAKNSWPLGARLEDITQERL